MGYIVELTAIEVNCTYTGSWYPSANSETAAYDFPSNDSEGFYTGSWWGLDNTWGATDATLNQISGSNINSVSLQTGSWKDPASPDHSWGVMLLPTESLDRNDVTSNQFPIVDQSVAAGAWDPFPIPVPPPTPTLPPRDLTRYRKAYSFGRNQPVRIRLVR
jgi:hypothetical protein